MLSSCIPMATVGVKGLEYSVYDECRYQKSLGDYMSLYGGDWIAGKTRDILN